MSRCVFVTCKYKYIIHQGFKEHNYPRFGLEPKCYKESRGKQSLLRCIYYFLHKQIFSVNWKQIYISCYSSLFNNKIIFLVSWQHCGLSADVMIQLNNNNYLNYFFLLTTKQLITRIIITKPKYHKSSKFDFLNRYTCSSAMILSHIRVGTNCSLLSFYIYIIYFYKIILYFNQIVSHILYYC